MSSTIKSLKSKHRAMMEDMVLNGLTSREVCEKYDMTEGRFAIIRKSPLWKLEERELRTQYLADRRKEMESLLPKAIDALRRNIICNNPTAEISAAKEILNRAGMPANLVVESTDKLESGALYETLDEIRKEKEAILDELGVKDVNELLNTKPTLKEEFGD